MRYLVGLSVDDLKDCQFHVLVKCILTVLKEALTFPKQVLVTHKQIKYLSPHASPMGPASLSLFILVCLYSLCASVSLVQPIWARLFPQVVNRSIRGSNGSATRTAGQSDGRSGRRAIPMWKGSSGGTSHDDWTWCWELIWRRKERNVLEWSGLYSAILLKKNFT